MRPNIRPRSFLLTAIVVAVGVAVPGAAMAGDNDVTELHAVKAGGKTLIVAVSARTVAFIDPKTKQTYRAWPTSAKVMKGAEQDFFRIQDVDRDGTIDVVATGKPAFIITGAGDPVSSVKIKGGCDQIDVADYAADKSADILCRKGTKITVTTHDGQKLWEYKITGLKLGACNFGDINGDLKSDIECPIERKGVFMRISGDGTEMGREFESAQLSPVEDDNPGNAATVGNLLSGQEKFDLDADGTAEEYLVTDGKMVTIKSKSRPKPMGMHEVGKLTSALVEDFDGDGAANLILGGEGKVFFIAKDGKLAGTAVVDAKKLKRASHVTVEGAGGNGLKDDSSESLVKATEAGAAGLAACYSSNVKKDPYTRVGRVVYNLSIDDKGKVKKAQRLHSDINDKKVSDCLKKAFGKIKYSAGTSPDASVTVTLQMGFIDSPK